MVGEIGAHPLDLDDAFIGAAEEGEERFPGRLAEDAEAGEGVESAAEDRVAAPGEAVEGVCPGDVVGKVSAEFGGAGRRQAGGGRTELEVAAGREAEFNVEAGPEAGVGVGAGAGPAHGLAPEKGFPEPLGGKRMGQGQIQPVRRGHRVPQRKLRCSARVAPEGSSRAIFQATGWGAPGPAGQSGPVRPR